VGEESEIKPSMLMHFSPFICLKLLEYCMHCWILSTYDKYQQRLSWLSARKHALATGHRVNIDIGKTFRRKTWKLAYTSTTNFYKVHINSLGAILEYILISDTRSLSGAVSSLKWSSNITSTQQCFCTLGFCSHGHCLKSSIRQREVTARKGNMKRCWNSLTLTEYICMAHLLFRTYYPGKNIKLTRL